MFARTTCRHSTRLCRSRTLPELRCTRRMRRLRRGTAQANRPRRQMQAVSLGRRRGSHTICDSVRLMKGCDFRRLFQLEAKTWGRIDLNSDCAPFIRQFRGTLGFGYLYRGLALRFVAVIGDHAHTDGPSVIRLDEKVTCHLTRDSVVNIGVWRNILTQRASPGQTLALVEPH